MEVLTLTPAAADVRFHLVVAPSDNRLTVKGRLVGPRCAYATTMEVAYPLRSLLSGEPDRLSARALAPEPNLWEPACPFLYETTLELFLDRNCIDTITATVGLRAIAISGRSFFLNGKRLLPKAIEAVRWAESDLVQTREHFNTVVLPASDDAKQLWDACDRIGLCVLGRVGKEDESVVQQFANHPSLLAWLLDDDKRLATVRANLLSAMVPIGLDVGSNWPGPRPSDADFIVVPASASRHFETWALPVIELASSL